MGKIFAILAGFIMMVGGVCLAIFVWWEEFYELVFGAIPPILFFVGLIALIAGISSIKDAKRAKKLDEEALSSALPKETVDEQETSES
jgi:4-hydroxybenzoate polyprenyltransferase